MTGLPADLLREPNDPSWLNLLGADPRATIFHHPAWSQLMADCYGYRPFVITLPGPGGTLRAGLPCMEVNSFLTGKRWSALPFSDYCQPLVTDDEALRPLSDSILSLATGAQIPSLDLRGTFADQPALETYSEHVIHHATLEPDVDKTYRRIHEMHRRNIKQARNNGVEIVFGDSDKHLREFYDLHLRTRRSQGVPIQPWRFFTLLKKNLLDQGLGFILLAYKDGQCLAGAVFLHWQKTLTYKYGASVDEGLKLRPNNLLFWTAMEWGCQHGYTVFDMGRTDPENTGLRTFKTRWGAEETLLYYSRTATSGHAKTGSGRMMGLMNYTLQRSPLWVCRLAGEVLYKHFG